MTVREIARTLELKITGTLGIILKALHQRLITKKECKYFLQFLIENTTFRIFTNIFSKILYELIEMNCTDKFFAFGGDCENLEGTYGALLLIKDILADVLIDFIEAKKFSFSDAVDIGNKMLYENPKKIFSLK